MNRRKIDFQYFLVTTTIVLGSFTINISSAHAQTTDPYVNSLLNQASQTIEDSNLLMQEMQPEVERYQAYLQQLYINCMNYNDSNACNEFQARTNAQINHMNQLQQQWDSHYNQRWIDSFGY
jgi:hypothetical protein